MPTIYRTVAKVKADVGASEYGIQWFSSEAQAKAARKKIAADCNLRSYKEVEVEQIDLPGSKAGMIEWLNENHTSE